ncbi:MAG: hypothetical protein COA44_01975 [Arcobacter sp.]|nr:MAG: hypothetical protein COA44_01975 [Arcobacter sp.]
MAGIGFELKKILKEDRLFSLVKMYSYSGLLSAGPWVISIIAILFVGFINIASSHGSGSVTASFQIVITYAIALASSLVITGFIQLPFTRYTADLIFAGREDEVLPSYMATLLVSWAVSFVLGLPLAILIFHDQSLLFVVSVVATFLVLCGVWISNILAVSLKYYKGVLLAYGVAYGSIVAASYFIGDSLEILIVIFFLGNALLLIILMTLIVKSYKSSYLINFGFFLDKNFYWSLALAGLFYNLGAWADKFIFWYHPLTGTPVIGALNSCVVYDMPIFIAYLSIIPGMAIFFYRLESDFANENDLFFNAVREGSTLELIERYRDGMIDIIRHSIREIMVVQGIINIMLFLGASKLFALLHIPQLYLGLFYILTIGAQLQLGFMSVLAYLYYLDRRIVAMWLSIAFFVLNVIFTMISIYMGPAMFGYGYTISLLLVFVASLIVLRREMKGLVYETFMLQ